MENISRYYKKGEINMYFQKNGGRKMTIKEVIEVLNLAKAMGKDLKNEEKNK